MADLVVVIHFVFVLFVVLGGLLVRQWPRVAYVHVPAAVWGAAIEFAGWICPLTPLENSLRRQAGDAGYAGGFTSGLRSRYASFEKCRCKRRGLPPGP